MNKETKRVLELLHDMCCVWCDDCPFQYIETSKTVNGHELCPLTDYKTLEDLIDKSTIIKEE